MITIVPAQGEEREAFLQSMGLFEKNKADVLLMKDGRELLGGAAVEILHSELWIWNISVLGDSLQMLSSQGRFVADSLLRACASFAANAGAFRLVSNQQEASVFLGSEGFRNEEGQWFLPTDAIVKFSKDSPSFM